VAPAVSRRRVVGAVVAAAAVMFVVAMAVTGGRRESGYLVRFEAAGLMAESPGEVDRVEMEREGGRLVLVRSGTGGWTNEGDGRANAARATPYLETSLRFMHVAAPARVMARGEWESTPGEEFGIAPPRYVVRLSGKGRAVLTTHFGAANPQQVLQYARVEGRDELYLLPRFVGVEWERVWEHATRR
jgi:hypothetical protein